MSFLLHQAFEKSAKRLPQKIAVTDASSTLTYEELENRASKLAVHLNKLGAKRGERIAFQLNHSIDQAIAIWAISSIDAIFVPVNEQLRPSQLNHILTDSGASILLTSEKRAQELTGSLSQSLSIAIIDKSSPLDSSHLKRLKRNECIESDLAALLYTSGSTGKPKGVMVSHKNLLAGAAIVSEYLDLSENDRLLGILPLSFDYGLNQLVCMLALGGHYRFQTFSFPQEIVAALVKHEITGLAGIPTLWALLVRSSLAKTKLPHLRFITNSGGAVPTAILDKLRAALPTTDVFLMYGLTEAFRSSFLDPRQLDKRPTSMGKAIPNTELFVLDSEGNQCKPGQIGELVHRGPTVSLGYWKRDEDTKERFRPLTCQHEATPIDEIAVYSGDLVKTDTEGFLYFVGRKDAMIKRSGFRISPSEIEEIVFELPFVQDAAAIGIDDGQAGQLIKVYVVSSETLTDGQDVAIIEHCSEKLARHMVPSFIEFIETLPKTASGKVDYPALKKTG